MSLAPPSAWNSYRRQAFRNAGATWATGGWSPPSQGSECLYLILSTMKDGDKSALDYFGSDEIGDLDGDGMKEILDGWGRPILFLRWAPGYSREQAGPDGQWGVAGTDDNGNMVTDDFGEFLAAGSDDFVMTTTLQTRIDAPDPFDPLKVDGQFALYPLILSGGLDKEFDIFTDNVPAPLHHYCAPNGPPVDNNYPQPYAPFSSGSLAGRVGDIDGDGTESWADNITNHFNEAQ
jgi:hypothetical protein